MSAQPTDRTEDRLRVVVADDDAFVRRALRDIPEIVMLTASEDGEFALAALRPVRSILSPREREVLDLLCEDKSTEEIARELYLVPDKVYSHVRSILRKLGVRSRQEAVAEVRRMRRADAPPVREA